MDLDQIIRRQHGVVSTRQALSAGLTQEQIRWALTSGRWVRLCRGIHRAQTGDLDWMGRAHALVLRAGDDAVLTLESASFLHRVASRPPQIITAAVPSARQVTRLAGTRIARRDRLSIVTRQGLPVTTAAQTALDLADVRGASWRDAVAEMALWVRKGRTTAEELSAALEARSRHQHRRVLMLALDPVACGAEDLIEVLYLTRVQRPHGLPEVQMQVPDVLAVGVIRRDAVYEAWGVVLELDGLLGHTGESMHRDRRRDRGTARTGRITLRAGLVELEADPCELAADVFATLRARGFTGSARMCGSACAVRHALGAA